MPKKIRSQAKGKSAKGGKPGPAAKLRAVRAAIKPKAAAPIKKAAKKAPAKRSAPKKKATAAKKATSAASAASKKKKNAAASPKAAQSKRKAAPAAAKTAPKKKAAAAPPAKKQSKAKKQAAPKAKAQKAPAKKQAAPKAKAQKAPAAKQAASAPASKPASRSSRAAPAPAPVASGPASRKRGRDVQSSEAGAGVAKAASVEAAPRPIKAARPSSVHELKVAPLANNKKNVSPQVRKVGKPVANAKKSMSPASKRAEEERVTAAEKKAAAALKARVDAVAAAEKKKQTEEGSKAAAAAAAAAKAPAEEKTHSWPARGCAFITTKEKNPLAPHWSCTGSKLKHHSFNISLGIHPWTKDEEDALMEGMELHGRSWSRILRDPRFAERFHKSRNQVKLKDKERCMRLSKSNEDGDRSLDKSEAASRRHGVQDGKRKKKEAWTEAETKLFRLAVEKEGVGSWKQIWETQPLLQKRTVVDLKDKWRNMNKAKAPSFLKVSSKTNMPINV